MKMVGYTDCFDDTMLAAEFLVKKAKEGNFCLICLGPLTNIALACILYPEFPSKIDEIYVMGGTILGKGNDDYNNEFNFFADPEATFRVFKDFKMIHLVPWEASVEFVIPVEDYDEMTDKSHPKSKFIGETHGIQMKTIGKYII